MCWWREREASDGGSSLECGKLNAQYGTVQQIRLLRVLVVVGRRCPLLVTSSALSIPSSTLCDPHTVTPLAMPVPVNGGVRKRDGKKAHPNNTNTPAAPTIQPITASTSAPFPVSSSHRHNKSSSFLTYLYYAPSPHLLLSPATARLYTPLSLLTLLVVFFVYFRTVYPSVTGGDSGELIISACNYGIAHPPGYPTWTMLMGTAIRLARLVWPSWAADFSPAYIVNLSNAVLGSVAAMLLYKTTALLTDNAWSGVMAAVGFACSPTVWLYSIQGEVFALNNMLCAAMAYLTVRYFESESRYLAFSPSTTSSSTPSSSSPPSLDTSPPSTSASTSTSSHSTTARARSYLASHALLYAYSGALVCGLAMTNQHTTVFYVAPCVLLVLYSLYTARLVSFTTLLTLGLLLALGMSPYLYLPIRAFYQPADSWGDQRTIAGFLTHFLRQEYGTFQLAASETSSDPGMWSRLLVYLKVTQEESLHLAPVLAVWGVLCLLRNGSRAVRLSVTAHLCGYVLYVVVFHKLANLDLRPLFLGVQARFWQQANMYVFVWAACGVQQLSSMLFSLQSKTADNVDPAGAVSPQHSSQLQPGNLLVAAVSLLYATAQIVTHYQRLDHSESSQFILNGRTILHSFPPHSIVLLNGDLNNNVIKYPQSCEGDRTDVQLLSLQLMTWDWFVPMQRSNYVNVTFPGQRYHVNFADSFTMRQFMDRNVRKHPIFLCGPWKEGDYSNVRTSQPLTKYYDDYPYGECSQMLPTTRPPKNLTRFIQRGLTGLIRPTDLPPFDTVRYASDSWEHVLYTDALQRLVYLTSYTSFHSNQQRDDHSLLALALQLTDELTQPDTLATLVLHNLMSAQDYRACGVIYGQWSKAMRDRGRRAEEQRASGRMRDMWRLYVQLNPQDEEVKRSVDNNYNPYTGVQLS